MQEDRMRWPTNLQKSCHTIRPPRSQRFSVCRGFWSLHLGIGQSCEFCQTIHVSRGPSFFRNLLKSPVSRIPSIPSIGWRHPLLHHQGALQRSGIGAPWASVIGMSQNVLPVFTVLIYMFYSGLYVSYSGLYMFLFRSHFAKDPKGFHLVGPLLTVRVDMLGTQMEIKSVISFVMVAETEKTVVEMKGNDWQWQWWKTFRQHWHHPDALQSRISRPRLPQNVGRAFLAKQQAASAKHTDWGPPCFKTWPQFQIPKRIPLLFMTSPMKWYPLPSGYLLHSHGVDGP